MKFLKDNFQFVYSLILIIFIPVAIVANTLWSIQNTQKNMDAELQRKAALAEDVFAGAVADRLENEAAIQTVIDQIIKSSMEVKEITVLRPQDDGFIVIASSDTKNLGLIYKSLQNTISWVQNESVASLTIDSQETNPERFWTVITPLSNLSGQNQALVNMKVSLQDIDALTRKTLSQSLIFLVITVFFVLLLLINHFRFFEYAVLFQRLKEVDKMKDDFISIASHELKTPMAAIKGYLSMIFEGVGGKVDQKARDHLDKAFANVRRLDVLVNELLDVSRLEQGRMQFDMQPMDITKNITEVISEIKVKADEKKLTIKYEPDNSLNKTRPNIFVDSDKIAQVLDNLLGNAIKYTFKGGVEISHQVEDNHLKTIIKDTGIGMSPEDRKRLFEKFYRIQNDQTINIPGTGLGLWITREIIHRMNGEIYVDSMKDVGSQFTIVFPIITEKK
ncbi:MAG: Two-component sensor histidine kinase [Berkelbacteria bacterium GW2011_GWA1_39_10]|uniref:histidine kinase n=1 Tax=Berkelbacteria bacterium GW2011_GWA1_39_10 TaxID=1618332 RepID=A0A0G0LSB2_9BACT|nr:MAG: Two-component sensor histidine kinase [Berkelbacteria bacterium GW2011_GWA1_39_10]